MGMVYRRFGRTGLQMPVLTCGGMRFQQAWSDLAWGEIEPAGQANVEACVRRAFDGGITHFETARGYGSSELQLGRILPQLPRPEIIVQTKVAPHASAVEFRRAFETSLTRLNLDYVDLFAIHGINDDAQWELTVKSGCLEAALELKAQGRVRFVGFSAHAPWPVLVKAIASDQFDYLNLHWFYVDQQNTPALVAARQHDMGVLIISPNDKGGKLYAPPPKLAELCRPLTPMAFGDLFCLQREEVHTISLGVARPSDFDAHLAVLPAVPQAAATVAPIVARLEGEKVRVLGRQWLDHWLVNLPVAVPDDVRPYHILRLYDLYLAFDLLAYGQMRYNLLGSGDHWFPGHKVDRMDWRQLPAALRESPVADLIPERLRAAHAVFNAADRKRLSQSET